MRKPRPGGAATCRLAGCLLTLLALSAAQQQMIGTSGSECMREMVAALQTSCHTDGSYSQLEALLGDYLWKCFTTNLTKQQALHVMLPSVAVSSAHLGPAVHDWTLPGTADDVHAHALLAGEEQLLDEVNLLFRAPVDLVNAFLVSSRQLGTVASEGQSKLEDVSAIARSDPDLDWQDILPVVRNLQSRYGGKQYCLPLDAKMYMLYYRRDLFTAYTIPRPLSWEDVVEIAAAWNTRSPQERNGTDYGFCLSNSSAARACGVPGDDLMAIAASHLQFNGTQQGVYFNWTAFSTYDSTSGQDAAWQPSLANTMGLRAAWTVYQALKSFGPRYDDPADDANEASVPCEDLEPGLPFAEGRCLMTISTTLFKRLARRSRFPPGTFAVTHTPGSYQVYNRTTRQLFNCTPLACPTSMPVVIPTGGGPGTEYEADKQEESDYFPPVDPSQRPPLQPGETLRYLNRAPFLARGSWLVCPLRGDSPQLSNLTYSLISRLTMPELSWRYVLDPDSSFGPFRRQHMRNVSRWVAAGYSPALIAQYLNHALEDFSRGNAVLELRVGGRDVASFVRDQYNRMAISAAQPDAQARAVTNQAAATIRAFLLDPTRVNFRQVVDSYTYAMGYTVQGPTPPPTSPNGTPSASPPDSTPNTSVWLPLAIALPLVAVLAAVAALIALHVRNQRRHHSLFGRVLPPGPGPDTTLLAAEVADLLELRSKVDPEVMERSIAMYKAAMLPLLRKYAGHVGAPPPPRPVAGMDGGTSPRTPGADCGLLLAFHSPEAALSYASDAQAALLGLDWPAALLAVPCCEPTYLKPAPVTAADAAAVPAEMEEAEEAVDEGLIILGGSHHGGHLAASAISASSGVERPQRGGGAAQSAAAAASSSSMQRREPQLLHARHFVRRLSTALGSTLGSPLRRTHRIRELGSVRTSETSSFAAAYNSAWLPCDASDPEAVLVFRGLAICMGLHTGYSPPSHHHHRSQPLTTEPNPSRWRRLQGALDWGREGAAPVYEGPEAQAARAASLSCPGAAVTLTDATYKRLPLERLWEDQLVLHMGGYRMVTYSRGSLPGGGGNGNGDACKPVNLYAAVSRPLAARLAVLLQRPACAAVVRQLEPGVADAPVGRVSIVFMSVVGAQVLLSWNAEVTARALKLFRDAVAALLRQHRGYLVEAVDGLLLAAFHRPSDAILWSLQCNEEMCCLDWPEELLSHELCQGLVTQKEKDGHIVQTVIHKGLGLKAGVDTGQVLADVHAMTGRLAFRGRVMNRAARVASLAASGEVLSSGEAWRGARGALEEDGRVESMHHGLHTLKGVVDQVDVYMYRMLEQVKDRRRSVVLANQQRLVVADLEDSGPHAHSAGQHSQHSGEAMGGLAGLFNRKTFQAHIKHLVNDEEEEEEEDDDDDDA